MKRYKTLSSLDWGLIATVTIGVVSWQLSIGDSITSRVASAILAGGVTLAVSLRLIRWYRKW